MPTGQYRLSEAGGPAGYAASAWACTYSSVVHSVVTIESGHTVICRLTNSAVSPRLTLVKQVDNTHGGSAGPRNWTLTAAGPTTITGKTGDQSVTGAAVPVGAYTLSESGGPAGYTAGAWSCTAGTLDGNRLTLALGVNATCTIVNTGHPVASAHLTLVKRVDTGQAGGTAKPADWTLTAAGPTTVSGASGTAAVTTVPLTPGAYALSESGGPAGYTASAWTCTGGTVHDGRVTVLDGVDVTCTITNTAQPSRLTLVDTIDDALHGPTHAWWLTATGPITITGKTGSKWVTNVSAPAGTYVLTHSNGPHSYADGSWTCTAGTLTGNTLQLPVGTSATCTLTEHKTQGTG